MTTGNLYITNAPDLATTQDQLNYILQQIYQTQLQPAAATTAPAAAGSNIWSQIITTPQTALTSPTLSVQSAGMYDFELIVNNSSGGAVSIQMFVDPGNGNGIDTSSANYYNVIIAASPGSVGASGNNGNANIIYNAIANNSENVLRGSISISPSGVISAIVYQKGRLKSSSYLNILGWEYGPFGKDVLAVQFKGPSNAFGPNSGINMWARNS